MALVSLTVMGTPQSQKVCLAVAFSSLNVLSAEHMIVLFELRSTNWWNSTKITGEAAGSAGSAGNLAVLVPRLRPGASLGVRMVRSP